jgi:hypothetical protein
MTRGLAFALACALSSAAACNAITGVGELDTASSVDATTTDGSTSGDGSTNGNTTDSSTSGSDVDATVPPLEECEGGHVCVPNTDGWMPAVHNAFGRPNESCPAEWPTGTGYKTSGGGGCECICTPASGSCEGRIEVRSGTNCTGMEALVPPMPGDGTCVNAEATFPGPPQLIDIRPSAPPPPSCGASVKSTLAPPRTVLVCSGAAAMPSIACATGEACVPKTATDFLGPRNCIVHDGEVACPLKLPMRTVIGTSVFDDRECGTCSCAPDACRNGTIEGFSSENCVNRKLNANTNGTCIANAASVTGMSFRYRASTGCEVQTPAQTNGRETVTAARTLCCAPPF